MKVSAFPVTSFPPQLWSRLLIRRMDSDFHLIRLTFLAKGGSKIILFWADKSSKALKHAGKDLINLLAELLWLLISRSPCWQPLPGAWWGAGGCLVWCSPFGCAGSGVQSPSLCWALTLQGAGAWHCAGTPSEAFQWEVFQCVLKIKIPKAQWGQGSADVRKGKHPLSALLGCSQGAYSVGSQPRLKRGFQTQLLTEVITWHSDLLLGAELFCCTAFQATILKQR